MKNNLNFYPNYLNKFEAELPNFFVEKLYCILPQIWSSSSLGSTLLVMLLLHYFKYFLSSSQPITTPPRNPLDFRLAKVY